MDELIAILPIRWHWKNVAAAVRIAREIRRRLCNLDVGTLRVPKRGHRDL